MCTSSSAYSTDSPLIPRENSQPYLLGVGIETIVDVREDAMYCIVKDCADYELLDCEDLQSRSYNENSRYE